MSKTTIKLDLVDKNFYLTDVYPDFNYYYRSFSTPPNLLKTNLKDVEFGTLEKNQFVLDGRQYFFNSPEITGFDYFYGLHSFSPCNNYLWNNFQMTLSFTEKYKSNGIQLRFSKYDYCIQTNAKFYLDDTLLKDITVDSDYYDYFVGDNVEIEFNKVIVTFIKCNNKKRMLKLYHVGMGETLIFRDNQIISANIIEECDPLCNELPINQAEFELYDKSDKFNILNPKGIYNKLKARLPIEVYHEEDGVERFMGKFYLDTWESESEDTGKLKGVNLIGLMDSIEVDDRYLTWFKDNNKYDYMYLHELVSRLFRYCKLSDYYTYNYDKYPTGKINTIMQTDTARNLLQSMCFVGGLIVSDARDNQLILKSRATEITSHITSDRIWQSTMKITKQNYINKFQIYGYNYLKSRLSETVNELAKYTLPGDGALSTFTFDTPKMYSNIFTLNGKKYISGENDEKIQVLSYNPWRMVVQLPEIDNHPNVTFKIEGHDFEDNKELYELTNILDTNEELKAITVDNNLISVVTSDTEVINNVDIAKRLQNYYTELYDLEFECQLEDEKVGDYVKVDCQYNQTFIGYITSLDIDLTGGYTAKVKMVGGLYNES